MRAKLYYISLILMLAFSGLVYPFNHFHFSYRDCGLPNEFDVRDINVHPDTFTDHHKDGHHHAFEKGICREKQKRRQEWSKKA